MGEHQALDSAGGGAEEAMAVASIGAGDLARWLSTEPEGGLADSNPGEVYGLPETMH